MKNKIQSLGAMESGRVNGATGLIGARKIVR
jgi:hypothetical protein